MKIYLHRLLCLFLLFSVCFITACDSPSGVRETDTELTADSAVSGDAAVIDLSVFSDEIAEEDMLVLDHAFSFQPLSEPEDGWRHDTDTVRYDNGLICIRYDQSNAQLSVVQRRFVLYDSDGTAVKTVPYTVPEAAHYQAREGFWERVRGVLMLDENTFHHTSSTNISGYTPERADELEPGYLMLCDASGTVLAESLIPGTGSNDCILRLSDGRIAVIGGDSICIFDENLQLKAQIDGNGKTALMESPRGELLAAGTFYGSYYRVDMEENTCRAETVYKHPDTVTGTPAMHFSVQESAYEVYFTNETGFWGYNAGEEAAQLLCSWESSGHLYSNLTVYKVIDENRIFVSVRDPFTDSEVFGYLYRDPAAPIQKKIPIRLGLVDDLRRFGVHNEYLILTNAVTRFNATNSDYFIEIVDYSNTVDERGEVSAAFTEAMLAGDGADIIISSRYLRDVMRNYTRKNAFVDLNHAFGTVLLPSVRETYTDTYGALYSVPLNMYLSMLVCREDILGTDEVLTLDTMYRLADAAAADGNAVFNIHTSVMADNAYTLYEKLLSAGAMTFADFETGECAYDSAEFAAFLQFLESLQTRDAVMDGMEFSNYYGDYEFTSNALFDALRSGEILFLEFPFHSVDAYAVLKLIYGDTAFAIHGYPGTDCETVRFRSDLDISINAMSEVKLGAAKFLAYLLSDELQTFRAETVLPVTVSAIEALLAPEEYVFSQETLLRLDTLYDENTLSLIYGDAYRVSYSEEDRALLRRLFYETEMQSLVDMTMSAIIEEELSAYRAGVRTLSEMQRILQSRLYIYVNE